MRRRFHVVTRAGARADGNVFNYKKKERKITLPLPSSVDASRRKFRSFNNYSRNIVCTHAPGSIQLHQVMMSDDRSSSPRLEARERVRHSHLRSRAPAHPKHLATPATDVLYCPTVVIVIGAPVDVFSRRHFLGRSLRLKKLQPSSSI